MYTFGAELLFGCDQSGFINIILLEKCIFFCVFFENLPNFTSINKSFNESIVASISNNKRQTDYYLIIVKNNKKTIVRNGIGEPNNNNDSIVFAPRSSSI